MRIRCHLSLLAVIICGTCLYGQVPSPDELAGFPIGADRKLVAWGTVVDYFEALADKSERVQLQKLGQTTSGQPLIMALISASNNLKNLARYRNLQKQASYPYALDDADALLLAGQNKLVVAILLNIQADEIASSQAALQLAHILATDDSPEMENILRQSIILLVPSTNPDGMQQVVDWYGKHVGTPYEGGDLPFLTHPYAGNDNANDWLLMNLVESKLLATTLFHTWFPHVVFGVVRAPDLGPRLLIRSFRDVAEEHLHPLLLSQVREMNRQMFRDLTFRGLRGISEEMQGSAWSLGYLLNTVWWHNMLSFTVAVANARYASPLFFPPGSLLRGDRADQTAQEGADWQSGWWRLRDAIRYEVEAALSLLKVAARQKQTIIYNYCKMNMDAIEQGKGATPFAFVVPSEQPDPVRAVRLLQALQLHGVQVRQPGQTFFAGDQQLTPKDYVILLQQPLRPFIMDVLANRRDKNRVGEEGRHRSTSRSSWALSQMMGVRIVSIDETFNSGLLKAASVRYPQVKLTRKHKGNYFIRPTSNRRFIAVNRVLETGKKIYMLKRRKRMGGAEFRPGTVYIPSNEINADKIDFIAQELTLPITQLAGSMEGQQVYRLRRPRVALYQPWYANPSVGWLRFLLEQHLFEFKTIFSAKIRKGNLGSDFDVVILPDMLPTEILNGKHVSAADAYSPKVPRPYLGGIADQGAETLRQFVMKGGTLITLNRACDFAIASLGLPVEPVLADSNTTFVPSSGALLEIVVNPDLPVGFGMPAKAAAFFMESRAFRPMPWQKKTDVIARYAPSHDSQRTGWPEGQNTFQGYASVLSIPVGKGRVVLIGFDSLHQAETPATYKFLFNAIHLSAAQEDVLTK